MPTCTYSFWQGVIPTSYFIFTDFYTCIISIGLHFTGEFGQVYKGYMKTKYKTDVVAVKTLKGEYKCKFKVKH